MKTSPRTYLLRVEPCLLDDGTLQSATFISTRANHDPERWQVEATELPRMLSRVFSPQLAELLFMTLVEGESFLLPVLYRTIDLETLGYRGAVKAKKMPRHPEIEALANMAAMSS
jgi:hypothetical protein